MGRLGHLRSPGSTGWDGDFVRRRPVRQLEQVEGILLGGLIAGAALVAIACQRCREVQRCPWPACLGRGSAEQTPGRGVATVSSAPSANPGAAAPLSTPFTVAAVLEAETLDLARGL